VRDIELTIEQYAALRLRNVAYNRQMSGTWKQAAKRRAERVAYQEEGRISIRAGDPLYVGGCMLFWAGRRQGSGRGALHEFRPRRVVQSIYRAVQELAGFTREAWLE
jgi:hypothetical protein